MKAARAGPVLAIILVSYLMIVLDVSIVITGLPKIREELGLSTTALSWVQNAYTLSFGGLLLLGARAGDLYGRRRMFVGGLLLFTAASVGIGAAPSAAWLLSMRALQGVGAAVLAPSTMALLLVHFDEGPARTRAVGYYGAVAGIGASIGLVAGGLFADWLSWRVGFFINLPIGLTLAWAAKRYLVETAAHSGQLDLSSALCATLGMASVVYGIVNSASAGWHDATTWFALVDGVVLLGLLVANERRAPDPILPLHLFADRQRAGAYLTRLLFLGGMVGFWFFTTQLLQIVLGQPPATAGLAFLPTTLPNFAAAMSVPMLTRRMGNARLLVLGLFVALVGVAWLSRAGADARYWQDVALPMIAIGVGQGLCLGPLTVAGIAGVAPHNAGAASGVVNVAHQLGGSLGLAILVAVFAGASASAAAGADARAEFAHGVSTTYLGIAVMIALALVAALALIVPSARAATGSPHPR
jgi:EmrB/QacA subfamily drug resistance transporter